MSDNGHRYSPSTDGMGDLVQQLLSAVEPKIIEEQGHMRRIEEGESMTDEEHRIVDEARADVIHRLATAGQFIVICTDVPLGTIPEGGVGEMAVTIMADQAVMDAATKALIHRSLQGLALQLEEGPDALG